MKKEGYNVSFSPVDGETPYVVSRFLLLSGGQLDLERGLKWMRRLAFGGSGPLPFLYMLYGGLITYNYN